MKLSKVEMEWFLIGIYEWHKNVKIINKQESPDFLCENERNETIGVECTQSIKHSYALMEWIYNMYSGKGFSAKEIRNKLANNKKEKIFLKFGQIKQYDNLTYYMPNKGLTDTRDTRVELINSIRTKTEKLNSIFLKYDKNVLVIYPRNCFLTNSCDCNEVLSEINKLIFEFQSTFDFIYIFNKDILYVCFMENGSYKIT